ncbi:UvrD-helicase domain-containing protein, partial [Myxococcota bacterium]|nr:UvrD-helicase domain-containing protein [Myxococcota bacterium]
YRGIVLQPPKGEDFVLVWVDHHDEAYQWAMNKVFEVNDVTGVMQVYDTVEVERVVERIDLKDDDSSSARTTNQTLPPEDSAPAWANGDGLFGECSDEDLCRLGVPRILLPSLRAITDQQTLEQLKPLLPEEVQEGLTYLSVGLSVDEVLVYLQSAPPLVNEVDTTDWRRALAHPQSRRSFSPIASTEEFEQILSGPLDAWRVFLHPSQDAIIRRSYSGPAKVLGGAGTGKTVVAMHRAVWLAQMCQRPEEKILFTAFNRNLATSIRRNLTYLAGEPLMERIDVYNISSWCKWYLNHLGQDLELPSAHQIERCWEEAIAKQGAELTCGFMKKEKQLVIDFHGIENWEQYKNIRRVGMGTRLTRGQRREIWSVYSDYMALLGRLGRREWSDIYRNVVTAITNDDSFVPYRAVIVDEAQDMTPEQWRVIRLLVPPGPDDLFITGDPHQRIYNVPVVLSHLGIETRGRSSSLKINYRTTEKIRDFAVKLLKGHIFDDLDGEVDSLDRYTSLRIGSTPIIERFATTEEEHRWVVEYIHQCLGKEIRPGDICLVAKSNNEVRVWERLLKKANVPATILNADPANETETLKIGTMHRVKGLEYPLVILTGVPSEDHLQASSGKSMEVDFDAFDRIRERSLLFTAATRARDQLVVLLR